MNYHVNHRIIETTAAATPTPMQGTVMVTNQPSKNDNVTISKNKMRKVARAAFFIQKSNPYGLHVDKDVAEVVTVITEINVLGEETVVTTIGTTTGTIIVEETVHIKMVRNKIRIKGIQISRATTTCESVNITNKFNLHTANSR